MEGVYRGGHEVLRGIVVEADSLLALTHMNNVFGVQAGHGGTVISLGAVDRGLLELWELSVLGDGHKGVVGTLIVQGKLRIRPTAVILVTPLVLSVACT